MVECMWYVHGIYRRGRHKRLRAAQLNGRERVEIGPLKWSRSAELNCCFGDPRIPGKPTAHLYGFGSAHGPLKRFFGIILGKCAAHLDYLRIVFFENNKQM